MHTIRLAYRDHDRTPVIYCIKSMAERHYGVHVDSIAEILRIKPYPTIEAFVNTDEIAAQEYGPTAETPLALWDLHWLRELDDEGFIDDLIASLG